MPSRAERLAELLKGDIATILRTKLNDHRVGFVSITAIEVTEDLSFAKVYVSCFGEDAVKKKTLRGLISAIPFIRKQLADRIEMRIVPNLKFLQDDSIELASKRIDILNKLAQEREAREKRSTVQEEN